MKDVSKFKPVPLKGQVFHAFDDGKIKIDRHMLLMVIDVDNRNSMKPWMSAVLEYTSKRVHWLFDGDTDYIISTETVYNSDEKYWFARSISGEWYALMVNSYMDACLLDVTGEYWNSMVNYYNENVAENKRDAFNKFVEENTIKNDE